MTQIILDLPAHKPSIVYPQIKKAVTDLDEKYRNILVKWRFLHSGNAIKVPKYDGSFITYGGIKFAGTPEQVFWRGFIEPYLKNDPLTVLRETAELSKKTDQNLEYCLDECEQLLGVMVHRTYEYMADTDQILKGDGFTKGPRKDVSGKISGMKRYLSDHRKIIELEFSDNITESSSAKTEVTEDILDLKPNFYGLGININAAFRKISKWWRKKI